jgi:uncharacterized membrane protein YdjX (TVP38/TMEM64 family)
MELPNSSDERERAPQSEGNNSNVVCPAVDGDDEKDLMDKRESQNTAGSMDKRMSVQTRESVKSILQDHYGTRVCRFTDCMVIFVVVVIVAAAVWAINTQDDKLMDLSRWIEGLGVVGPAVFLLLFLWVGLPCGYQWSTIVVLVGFAYGWAGIALSNFSTAIAAVVSYYSSRFCMRKCMLERIRRLSVKKRMYLLAVIKVIESDRGGFLMQVVLRMQPFQTFGVTNAFLGACTSIPIWKFAFTTLVGMQQALVMLTSVGVLVRDVGSLEQATKSSAGRLNLFVTVGIAIVAIVICFFFGRYLAIYVLPEMIEEEAEVDSAPPNVDLESDHGVVDGDSAQPVCMGKLGDDADDVSPRNSGLNDVKNASCSPPVLEETNLGKLRAPAKPEHVEYQDS